MLISNTMRFGTDTADTDFKQLPRLKARVRGSLITVKMTDFKISSPSLVVRIDGQKYYVWLVDPADSVATQLHIKIGGKTYAVGNTA